MKQEVPWFDISYMTSEPEMDIDIRDLIIHSSFIIQFFIINPLRRKNILVLYSEAVMQIIHSISHEINI